MSILRTVASFSVRKRTMPQKIGSRRKSGSCILILRASPRTTRRLLGINCLADAKFNYVLSTFNDKNFGNNHLTIAKVSATTKLILEHVLKEVRVTHADVLYSVVVSKDVSATRPRYAFFDVKFQSMSWYGHGIPPIPDSSIVQPTPSSRLTTKITTHSWPARSP